MGDAIDEAELIRRSRQGDLAAFNGIVACYQDQVYNLCLRMLRSPQAAEDAAQETFLAAFRHVAHIRGSSLRAWLLRIAANACIDELRRRRRRPQLPIETPASRDQPGRVLELVDPAEGPEALALRTELSQALQAELLALPPDQRLAVILCDVEGLSYDEIAASLGCSLGTVKSRISRGRLKLRERLRSRPELFADLLRHREMEDIEAEG